MKSLLKTSQFNHKVALLELMEVYLPLALATWNPDRNPPIIRARYLRQGIRSEVGELADYEKRRIRGDSHGVTRDDLVYELGDLLWYSMVQLNEAYTSISKSQEFLDEYLASEINESWLTSTSEELLDYILSCVRVMTEYQLSRQRGHKVWDSRAYVESAACVVLIVLVLCEVYDVAPAEVFVRNAIKLQSRLDKGQIAEVGDGR